MIYLSLPGVVLTVILLIISLSGIGCMRPYLQWLPQPGSRKKLLVIIVSGRSRFSLRT